MLRSRKGKGRPAPAVPSRVGASGMTVWRDSGVFRDRLRTLLGHVLVLHDYDVLGWMFNPFSELVDVSVAVHGFDERGRRYFDDFRALDNRFQGDADGFSTASKNTGRVDVAIDRGVVRNTVLASDLVRAAPAEEFVFDGFAVGMAAEVAPSSVRAHCGARPRLGGATGVATQATAEPIVPFGFVLALANALASVLRLGSKLSLFNAACGMLLASVK